MKKLMCMMVSLMLALSVLTGCVGSGNGNPQDKTGPSKTEATENGEATGSAQESTEGSKQDMQSIMTKFSDVWVKCPAEWGTKKEGIVTLMGPGNNSLVTFCVNTLEPYQGGLDGVFDFYKDKIPPRAAVACQGELNNASIEMISSEKVTVNGYESIRFVGTAPNASGWDCHVYGYTFLIDNIPYAIVGIVSQKEQEADLIASNKEDVDLVASTIKKG